MFKPFLHFYALGVFTPWASLRLRRRLLQDLLDRRRSLGRHRSRSDLLILLLILDECGCCSGGCRCSCRPALRGGGSSLLLILSIVVDEAVPRDATTRLVDAHVHCPPAQAELVTCEPCARALNQAGELGALRQQILEGHLSDGSRIGIRAGRCIKDQGLELVTVLLLAEVQLDVRRIGGLIALPVTSELRTASVVVLHDLTRQLLLEPEPGVGRCSGNHVLIDLCKRLVELVRLRTLLVITHQGQIDRVLQGTARLVVKGVQAKGRRQTRSLEGELALIAAIIHVGTLCTHRPRDGTRGIDGELSKLEILRLDDRRGHLWAGLPRGAGRPVNFF